MDCIGWSDRASLHSSVHSTASDQLYSMLEQFEDGLGTMKLICPPNLAVSNHSVLR